MPILKSDAGVSGSARRSARAQSTEKSSIITRLVETNPQNDRLAALQSTMNASPKVQRLAVLQRQANKTKPTRPPLKEPAPTATGIPMQLHLKEDFENLDTRIAVCGEEHGMLAKEADLWGEIGVRVMQENETLEYLGKYGTQEQVKPDDPLLNFVFLWQFLWEGAGAVLNKLPSSRKTSEKEGLSIFLNELILQVKDAMDVGYAEERDARIAIHKVVAGWKNENDGKPETNKSPAPSAVEGRRLVDQLLDGLLEKYGFSDNVASGGKSDETSTERSYSMLQAVNAASQSSYKLVYKVGDTHIDDLMKEDRVGPAVGVELLKESAYLEELGYMLDWQKEKNITREKNRPTFEDHVKEITKQQVIARGIFQENEGSWVVEYLYRSIGDMIENYGKEFEKTGKPRYWYVTAAEGAVNDTDTAISEKDEEGRRPGFMSRYE